MLSLPEIRLIATSQVPTRWGRFICHAFESSETQDAMSVLGQESGTQNLQEHVVFVMGELVGAAEVLVRVHSECLTGDVFGSWRCDCGAQLHAALDAIAANGTGLLVYLRGHEGRGIGIGHKVQAYALQDHGRDTVDANLELGLPVDARNYGIGAAILMELGVERVALMTNNPAKYDALAAFGLTVTRRVSLEISPRPENLAYLRAKQQRLGHLLDLV
ncbi:MAG: GTP cyclohydrolase II [Acidimicrobiia bacterium]|nr:GTP cyclohydrolase II [Acidimicrobiia bacterium]MYC57880.1 GTP cyclohydrolase II [Acidimicrobiia bacterium]MYG93413.1 GTP cyclohydrolase II [Acidimicrobiia bacterium]MYI31169.1 GTP cyclohydrolase II [Acidimicrobiia bacterium]